jgi:hypothetical protein
MKGSLKQEKIYKGGGKKWYLKDRKGKLAEKQGRKASGLSSSMKGRNKTAGLPKSRQYSHSRMRVGKKLDEVKVMDKNERRELAVTRFVPGVIKI